MIDKMMSKKMIEPFDSVTLQASPTANLCQTVPEWNYFYNACFKKGEKETERGLRCFIGHESDL